MQREHIASHPYAGITRIRSEGLQRHYTAISADFASAPLGIGFILAPLCETVKRVEEKKISKYRYDFYCNLQKV